MADVHRAAARGQVKRLRSLLERGRDQHARDDHDGATPLHRATQHGTLEAVRLLLDEGADGNATMRDGWTPLHCAARRGDAVVARALLEHGADVAARAVYPPVEKGGVTALHLAVLASRTKGDSIGALSKLKGNSAYVMDYLITEVLDAQPPAIQLFLLSTSILDRFTAPLCDALLELDFGQGESEIDGADFIAKLQTENLFLIALDNENRWYRQMSGEKMRVYL